MLSLQAGPPKHACPLFASCLPTSCIHMLLVLGTMTQFSKAIYVCHESLRQSIRRISYLSILCIDTAAGFQQFSTWSKQPIRQFKAAKGSASAARNLAVLSKPTDISSPAASAFQLQTVSECCLCQRNDLNAKLAICRHHICCGSNHSQLNLGMPVAAITNRMSRHLGRHSASALGRQLSSPPAMRTNTASCQEQQSMDQRIQAHRHSNQPTHGRFSQLIIVPMSKADSKDLMAAGARSQTWYASRGCMEPTATCQTQF